MSLPQASSSKVTNRVTGNMTRFRRDESGLYTATLNPAVDVQFLNTVAENKKLYTKKQVEGAERARKLYQVIGFPSIRDYIHVIQTNQIKNCPVTVEDVRIAQKIFGTDIYALKGKTTRRPQRALVNDYVEIPRELIEAQQGITLYVDVMWVDEVPFLTTLSKNLRFITVKFLPNRKAETLEAACKATFAKYNTAGFYIREFHADPEFLCIQENLEKEPPLKVTIVPSRAHLPVLDRMIRTIKERYRALFHRLPYSMWPKLMIIHAVTNAVKWLNTFPPKGGISTTYSPRTIITGRQIDFKNHCTISFGSYVQAVADNDPTNTPRERTIDAVFLRALDNVQGGYEVLNLKTGKSITRHRVI